MKLHQLAGVMAIPLVSVCIAHSSAAREAPAHSRMQELPVDAQVAIPHSELFTPPSRPAAQDSIGSLELGVSSWAPSEISRPSFLNQTTRFDRTSWPRLSLNYLGMPLVKTPLMLAIKAGTSLSVLSRRGEWAFAGFNQTREESLYLLSARLAIEATSHLLSWHQVQPFLSVGLLPSLALISQSPFSDGFSDFGLPIESVVGASAGIEPLAQWVGSSSIHVVAGVVGTFSSFKADELKAWGLEAALRLGL